MVCLVLIGAIQAIQHGERARETDTEGERERGLGLFSFFFPGGNLLSTRFWILKKKKKNNRTWKLLCVTSSESIFPGDTTLLLYL